MVTSPGSLTRSGLTSHWPYLLLLVWPFVLLWPVVAHPDQVLMQPGAQFSDLFISHWPNAEFIRQSLFEFHQFPLWNPYMLGGAPFAADPLAGLWYPPNWLAVVLPLPFAFNLLFALHLAWGGWGLYRWAHADGFSPLAALVGGLAFAAMPKLIAHIAAGHMSLVFAVCWTPWLLWAAQRASRTEAGAKLRLGPVTLTALIWAMTFLADVRWGVMAGLVLAVWWLATGTMAWRQRLIGLGLSGLMFLLLAGVLWLPLVQFVQLTPRAELTPDEAAIFSLPPNYLIGLVIPNLGGSQEYMTYVGLVALALAIMGLRPSFAKDRVGTITMVAWGLGAIWWALGPGAGLFWIASRIPGLSLLRVPSRAWFIVGLAVCWLAVRGAAMVEAGWRPTGKIWNLGSAAVLGAIWILAIGGSLITHKPLLNLLVTAVALTALGVGLRLKWALPILLVALLVEVGFVDATLIEARPVQPNPVAEWLGQQPGVGRVYSPSYSLPALAAVRNHLEQVDGINPLQLASMVAYMEQASGVKRNGYSVTVPSFEGDVSTANKAAVPDAHLLGALNVRFVVSEFDIVAEGLTLQTTIGNTRIYENAFDSGRVQGGTVVSKSPNKIVITTDNSDTVSLAEIAYPGWTATLDGAEVPVEQDGIFRTVTVGSGAHTLVFEFQPTLVWIGLGLSGLGLLLALYLLWVRP